MDWIVCVHSGREWVSSYHSGLTRLGSHFLSATPVILQMRVYAMYSLNKTVLVVLVTTFFASTGVAAWVMQSVLSKIVRKSNYHCLDVQGDLTWFYVQQKRFISPMGQVSACR